MPSRGRGSCSWQVALRGQVGQLWSWLASSSSTAILRISRISSVVVQYLQARLRRRRAGALDAASLDLHQAQSARAIHAQFGVIAERRQVDVGFANQLEQIALAVDRYRFSIDQQSWLRDLIHLAISPSTACELACCGAGAALDAERPG